MIIVNHSDNYSNHEKPPDKTNSGSEATRGSASPASLVPPRGFDPPGLSVLVGGFFVVVFIGEVLAISERRVSCWGRVTNDGGGNDLSRIVRLK